MLITDPTLITYIESENFINETLKGLCGIAMNISYFGFFKNSSYGILWCSNVAVKKFSCQIISIFYIGRPTSAAPYSSGNSKIQCTATVAWQRLTVWHRGKGEYSYDKKRQFTCNNTGAVVPLFILFPTCFAGLICIMLCFNDFHVLQNHTKSYLYIQSKWLRFAIRETAVLDTVCCVDAVDDWLSITRSPTAQAGSIPCLSFI